MSTFPGNREEEPCYDCDGDGCETCGLTGFLYTEEAIRDQMAVEEEHRED